MRMLRFIVQKEFRQIFRDKSILRMIFIMPIMQLIILPQVANYDVKNMKVAFVDHDNSTYTRSLEFKINESAYFDVVSYQPTFEKAMDLVEHNQADIIIEIPNGFETNLVREQQVQLLVAINAINGVKAGLGASYLANTLVNFNNEIRLNWIVPPKNFQPINIVNANWYNPEMGYKIFMVPGILAILLTMIGSFLSALNIVKEKEIGTIEQINVTPISKTNFIIGKLFPFWVMGLIVLTLGLIVARVFYGIVPVGNIALLYLFSAIFLFAVLGMGLLISTFAQTQQQAMLIAFFMMMVFILLSGLYTSIDSMPYWAQVITWFNPVKYFIEVMRMVVIKGSGFFDILNNLLVVSLFGIVLNSLAIKNYKKRA